MTKIIFMGTPEFAVPALKGLLKAHEVVAVYTQPPRPAGRGQKDRKSPIHLLAEQNNIPFFTPTKLATCNLQPAADIAVVAAYGLLLPEWFLQSFKYGCINIHPSALPRWRGAAPIQRTVLAGDTHTDICIMQMEKGLDTGAVLKRESLPVPPRITSGELHDILAEKSVPLLLDVLKNIDSITPQPQSAEGITYARKIEKSEARIDWNKSAEEIDRLVRGLNPFPGAYFEVNGERVKVWQAEVVVGVWSLECSGKILDDTLLIRCGGNALRLLKLQREGKKAVSAEEFLRGFPLTKLQTLNSNH
jgi:methionyl-tRNA formyltransferase